MASRLISLRELDEIEGLVEHHRKVQERLEALVTDAAQFDTPVQGALELSRKGKALELRRGLVTLLERNVARVKQ